MDGPSLQRIGLWVSVEIASGTLHPDRLAAQGAGLGRRLNTRSVTTHHSRGKPTANSDAWPTTQMLGRNDAFLSQGLGVCVRLFKGPQLKVWGSIWCPGEWACESSAKLALWLDFLFRNAVLRWSWRMSVGMRSQIIARGKDTFAPTLLAFCRWAATHTPALAEGVRYCYSCLCVLTVKHSEKIVSDKIYVLYTQFVFEQFVCHCCLQADVVAWMGFA